jgi:hypothetical protein
VESGTYLLRDGRIFEKRCGLQLQRAGRNTYSLDSFLAFLAAFFSFGLKVGFFLSSLLLRCSLLMVVFQRLVRGMSHWLLGIPKCAELPISKHQHTPLPLKEQLIAGK